VQREDVRARTLRARPYRTTLEGRKRPWDIVERLVPELIVEATSLGETYGLLDT
jgi:hypothetical protein